MESVKALKISDGLFSISWEVKISFSGLNKTVEINNLEEFSKFTGLGSFKLKHFKVMGVKEYLELTAVPSASALKPFKIESGIHVEASRNGDHDKMMYIGSQTKWIASWSAREIPSSCKCFSPAFTICQQCERTYPFEYGSVFEIMILVPGSVISLNSEVATVLKHLSNLWKNKTLSDVQFKCADGKSIEAHTMIVASGSPVLAALFQNGFKENQERVVDIVDVKPDVFENLLRYIYTGRASPESEEPQNDVEELFIAADRYAMESLKDRCAMRMSRDLSVDNVVYFLILAQHYNSKCLYELTLDFMMKNADTVVSGDDWTDLKIKNPDLTFKVQQHLISRLANDVSGLAAVIQ